MKQTLEEAAYDYATNKTKFRKEVLKEVDPDNYVSRKSDCMEDFQCGAEWQAKQLSCISAYEKLLESNKDDFLSHHIDKVKMEIIRIVANDAQAVTFQTLGQYRSWLMKTINELNCLIPEL